MSNNLQEKFAKTYPNQRIKKVLPYKGQSRFVVAESTKGEDLMDPFYIYNPLTGVFSSYQPTANLDEFYKLLGQL